MLTAYVLTLLGAIPALTVNFVSLNTASRICCTHSSAVKQRSSQYDEMLHPCSYNSLSRKKHESHLRYASSHPPGHIVGSYWRNISIIFPDISKYLWNRFGTVMRSGQSFFATKPYNQFNQNPNIEGTFRMNVPAIPERTPYFLASYDAVVRTPRPTY